MDDDGWVNAHGTKGGKPYVSHIKQLHQHLRYGLVPILLMRKTEVQ